MTRTTIGDLWNPAQVRPTGFDYLRVVLSVAIVIWHTCVVCYGWKAQVALATGFSRPLWSGILPMFFALSGFLVAGSLERSKTLISFLGLRIIRLVPGLAVESLLCIFLLGTFFTSLGLAAYFSNSMTWSYLLNIVGRIHFTLPGVFAHSATSLVNSQLWTLPWELGCYASIALVAVIGIYKRPRWLLPTVFAFQAVAAVFFFYRPGPDIGLMDNMGLIVCFMFGILLYAFRASIPLSATIFVGAFVISFVLLCFRSTEIFVPAPIAYVTVWLGLRRPKLIWPLTVGDYSYAIFLYGFPIQQAVAAALPWSRHWWINLILSLPLIFVFSAFSWHIVEKPAQKLRGSLFAFEGWMVALVSKRIVVGVKA
jgi:peptidoglycan/LPS O-acetylase OafA/YrhL